MLGCSISNVDQCVINYITKILYVLDNRVAFLKMLVVHKRENILLQEICAIYDTSVFTSHAVPLIILDSTENAVDTISIDPPFWFASI